MRLVVAVAAAVSMAVLAAIALAVIDIYLSGHNQPLLNSESIIWPRFGVVLSLADLILLVSTVAAGAFAWVLTRPRG